MIRDRRTLLALLVANIFVMAGALFVMRDRYLLMKSKPPAKENSGQSAPVQKETAAAKTRDLEAEDESSEEGQSRNILFTYRNSKPSQVEIIASFNDWAPRKMKKGPNHTWSINVPLEPGDYTYNFLVDGKAIRDPNNRRTAPEGRSLLTVKPLNE